MAFVCLVYVSRRRIKLKTLQIWAETTHTVSVSFFFGFVDFLPDFQTEKKQSEGHFNVGSNDARQKLRQFYVFLLLFIESEWKTSVEKDFKLTLTLADGCPKGINRVDELVAIYLPLSIS